MSDDRLTEHSRQLAFLRKFAFQLADTGPDEDLDLHEAVDRAVDRVEKLEHRLDELEDMKEMLSDVGTQKTSKEEKVAAIVTYASQKHSGMRGTVVKPKEIAGIVDVSKRYAYDLIDDIVHGDGEHGSLKDGGYDWAVEASSFSAVDKETPERGLAVDFERLHEDDEALNKFINGQPVEGGL